MFQVWLGDSGVLLGGDGIGFGVEERVVQKRHN